MRPVLIFPFVLAVASAQLFGGLSNILAPNPIRALEQLPQVSQLINSIPLLNNVLSFGDFLAQTGKTYATAAERALRERIFVEKLSVVNRGNQAFDLGQSTFKLAINAFADLSSDEIVSQLTGRKRTSAGDAMAKPHRRGFSPARGIRIPDSFDWRQKGGVTPVEFQGYKCMSCWSFAVTGAVEGHVFRKTKVLQNLSEQNLIDCSSKFGDVGCRGGYQDYGFAYIIQNMGVAKEDRYPYVAKDEKCKYKNNYKGAEVKGIGHIEPGNENQMKEVIATLGPLACSVYAGLDSFQMYKEGIYDDEKCNLGDVNHSILVVGYGSEKGKDYWIVKNAWTDKWGEAGYIRIPRNRNSFCGIASECSYPIV